MFNSIVIEAKFNSKKNLWQTKNSNNDIYYSKFLITAAGCISATNIPDIKGLENFKGKYYHTGNRPKSIVDLKGKKVFYNRNWFIRYSDRARNSKKSKRIKYFSTLSKLQYTC